MRLIGEEGEQLGVVSRFEAQNKADEAGLDLVLMSPNSNPPVCKLMDYGKYKFDTLKKEKEMRKNQKISEIKELQLEKCSKDFARRRQSESFASYARQRTSIFKQRS